MSHRWGAMLILLSVVGWTSFIQPGAIDGDGKTKNYLCVYGMLEDRDLAERLATLCAKSHADDPHTARQAEAELRGLTAQMKQGISVIRVEEQAPATFYLATIQSGNGELRLPVFLLVDGIQVSFKLAENRAQIHHLTVPEDEGDYQPSLFRYEIPTPSEGLHNVRLSFTRFFPSDSVQVPGFLRSIFHGEGQPPDHVSMRPPDDVYRFGVNRSEEETAFPHKGLFLSRTAEPTRSELQSGWNAQIEPGTPVSFFIQIRALCLDQQRHRYLVTAFIDGIQVPLRSTADGRAYFKLACGQEARFETAVTAPQQPGEHSLVPYAMMNPYRQALPSYPRGETPFSLIGPFPRYTIEVASED